MRLGDRFPWCADAQGVWDYQAETLAQLEAAETALQEAQRALDAATDDLDRAEAQQALEAAEMAHADAALRVQGANRSVTWLIAPDRDLSDDTEAVAMQRAAEAWRASADPAIVELRELALLDIEEVTPQVSLSDEQPVSGIEVATVDEALAVIDQVQAHLADVVFTIRDALWELDDSIAATRTAASPEAAEAAYQRAVDATYVLAETAPRYFPAIWDWEFLAPAEVSFSETVQEAITKARRPPRIRDDIPAWVTERETEKHAADYANYAVSVGRNRAEDALTSAVAALAVADTAGMAALQASLQESCKP